MIIRLRPEQELIVNEELKSGHFNTAEDVIAEALHALREKDHSSIVCTDKTSRQNAVREMLVFAEKNSVRLEGVSVKELIHEGRIMMQPIWRWRCNSVCP